MILTMLLWPLTVITWLVLTVIGFCLGKFAWWWLNDRKPKPPRAVAKEPCLSGSHPRSDQ